MNTTNVIFTLADLGVEVQEFWNTATIANAEAACASLTRLEAAEVIFQF
jgi:hypothetical protein